MISILKRFNKKLFERERYLKIHKDEIYIKKNSGHTIWFHAASMGEFEQAKPVIELLKSDYPDSNIVVSFFSPSGFNTQKKYKFADYICYLPFDTKENAKHFITRISPDLVVFIRYEIWRNYLLELKKKSIPIFLIDATRPSGKLFRTFPLTKNFIKSNMNLFNEIHTVSEMHSEYFRSLFLQGNIKTLTDTRFDRIAEFVKNAKTNLIFPEEFLDKNELVLVAGSTWEPDEDIIFDAVKKHNQFSEFKVKTIYVPHEPTQEHLLKLTSKLGPFIFLSEILKLIHDGNLMIIKEKLKGRDLVVDSIGFLLRLYNYADLAYIGGAFGAGIHSVTEAAGYGLPLASGPDLKKSSDAVKLNEINALTIVRNTNELRSWLYNLAKNIDLRKKTGNLSRNYIFDSIGSTNKTVNVIKTYLKII